MEIKNVQPLDLFGNVTNPARVSNEKSSKGISIDIPPAKPQTTRAYKDTFFRYVFSEKRTALELYNALTGSKEVGNVEFLGSNDIAAKFNDLAFTVGNQLVAMCEHQSSPNPNMPIRLLQYVVQDLYARYASITEAYGPIPLLLPKPRFFVLYNGAKPFNVRELRLSDAFLLEKGEEPSLQVVAKVINIRYDVMNPSLQRCKSLSGYSRLIFEIENNKKTMPQDVAIKTAVDFCTENGILTDMLLENFKEALDVLAYTYSEEHAKKAERMTGKLEMIAGMLKEGLPYEQIARIAGISEKELEVIESGIKANRIFV